jgi:hypothetical protein
MHTCGSLGSVAHPLPLRIDQIYLACRLLQRNLQVSSPLLLGRRWRPYLYESKYWPTHSIAEAGTLAWPSKQITILARTLEPTTKEIAFSYSMGKKTHARLAFIYGPAPELIHHKDLQSIFIHIQTSPIEGRF